MKEERKRGKLNLFEIKNKKGYCVFCNKNLKKKKIKKIKKKKKFFLRMMMGRGVVNLIK